MITFNQPVAVTGATGYVAGELIKQLLALGAHVHACVRANCPPQKREAISNLIKNDTLEGKQAALTFFETDLLEKNSFDTAFKGCGIVFHTASPFIIDAKDPQKDLITPAVEGTHNVLNSVNCAQSVKRVVLTSSVAAMYGDNSDITSDGELDEHCWNTTSTLHHNPYALSKTLAEQAAWQIHDAQTQWQLITINPSLVIGEPLSARVSSDSFNLIKRMLDGTMRFGCPKWGVGAVSVHDVALAHILAAHNSKANGRYLISAENTNFYTLACLLKPMFNHYPLPKNSAPKWLIWLLGSLFDKSLTRKMVSNNIDVVWQANTQKSQTELGLHYQPIQPVLEKMAHFIIKNDLL